MRYPQTRFSSQSIYFTREKKNIASIFLPRIRNQSLEISKEKKDKSLQFMDYRWERDVTRLTFPNVIPRSSEGRHRNAITVVYGFVTAIHPGIAGQWVDEVGVFAASNDFSWEANLDDELNPCLPLPTSLSVHPPEYVPPWRDHPRRPRIRIKFKPTTTSTPSPLGDFAGLLACRINREHRRKRHAEI